MTYPVQIAFYKAPGTLVDKAVRVVTRSKYSHCELIINGTACSSSVREGGVRFKSIALDPTRWDVANIQGVDLPYAWKWFCDHHGQGYDYLGVTRFVLPFIPSRPNLWFCSEACAAALQLPDPHLWAPKHLALRYPPQGD